MRIGKFEIKNYFIFGVFCLLVISLIAGVIYGGFYVVKKYSSSDDFQKILADVGELVELPEGEEPTWATVTDPNKLSGQEFFAQAQVGDKVLIFSKSKKAILYRPSEKKIIEIGPII